eukprot:3915798-Alexandrium_andersonii.AAC.1
MAKRTRQPKAPFALLALAFVHGIAACACVAFVALAFRLVALALCKHGTCTAWVVLAALAGGALLARALAHLRVRIVGALALLARAQRAANLVRGGAGAANAL